MRLAYIYHISADFEKFRFNASAEKVVTLTQKSLWLLLYLSRIMITLFYQNILTNINLQNKQKIVGETECTFQLDMVDRRWTQYCPGMTQQSKARAGLTQRGSSDPWCSCSPGVWHCPDPLGSRILPSRGLSYWCLQFQHNSNL